MLYETEEIDGISVSTLRAWYLWITVVLEVEPTSGNKLWNNFVRDAFLDIENHRYTCILASRGLGKSYLVYVLYSLFKMYLFEYTKIIVASNVPKMCKRNVREAKRMIDSNEMLLEKKAVYKKRELIWSQEQFEFNEGVLETATAGSNVRSAHVNYVFIDDILRDDFKYSNDEVENFVFGQLFPIAQRFKARLVLTGTPIHIRDLYHDAMNTHKNFMGKRISTGAISDRGFWSKEYKIIEDWSTKKIYLPTMWTWWELADEKNPQSMINTQGNAKFMREYMLVCTDESTSMFSETLLKQCASDYSFLYSAEDVEQGEMSKDYMMAVDVATAGEASSDNSAFIVLELMRTEHGVKKIVRHVTVEKGMPISGTKDAEGNILDMGQVETIQELSNRFNHCYTIVEKNNVGVALIQELQKRNVPVDEFVTTKASKENMLRYLVSEMKNGNLFFAADNAEIRALKRELLNFGVIRSKAGKERLQALAGHDDMVISLAIANYASSFMTQVPYIAMETLY